MRRGGRAGGAERGLRRLTAPAGRRPGRAAERRGRGIAEQVALARRESPHRGRQHLGLAKVLADGELPHTRAAFAAGRITEWRATLIARETACLELSDRLQIDNELAGDSAGAERLEAMGDAELVAEVRRRAYALDPAAFVTRRRRAEAERRVTLRPAPDVMAHLGALLPVAQGVAVHAALSRDADTKTAAGDPRSRGQIMADTLVARVTGHETAPAVPVQVVLMVPDAVLFGTAEDPAHLDGYGPIPAELARELVHTAIADAAALTTLRRVYVRPHTRRLVAMDSVARCFPDGLDLFIRLRDRICRTPWCDAPIRHTDHVTGHVEGGATSEANGQGLCESCNHAKQARGWHGQPRPGPHHETEIHTPTGHRYRSRAPAA